jgi:uncharacterized membrane protein YfcA
MNISMVTLLGLLVLGVVAGIVSGVVGIGGGIVIVPALVMIFAMSQKMAQGTSLIMLLPPIGILAVIQYYKAGNTDIRVACILIAGFFVGSYFSAKMVGHLEEITLKRIFGAFLMILAIKYLFFSTNK